MLRDAQMQLFGTICAGMLSLVEDELEDLVLETDDHNTEAVTDMVGLAKLLARNATDPSIKTISIDLSGWEYEPAMQASKTRMAARLIELNSRVIEDAVQAGIAGLWGEFGPLYDYRVNAYEISISQDKTNNKVGISMMSSDSVEVADWVDRDPDQIRAFLLRSGLFSDKVMEVADMSTQQHLHAIGQTSLKLRVLYDANPVASGYWRRDQQLIDIYFRPTAVDPPTFAAEYKIALDTIRHELQHATQDIMQTVNFRFVPGGTPSKKPSTTKDLSNVKPSVQDDLQPIEFHPRLADTVSIFKQYRGMLPRSLLGRAIKIFGAALDEQLFPNYGGEALTIDGKVYSPNIINTLNSVIVAESFMKSLKAHDTAKWKKAFSELYAGVSN